MKIVIIVFVLFQSLNAQAIFQEYFIDKTLRFDFFHSGNDTSESIIFDELIEEPIWGGRKQNLVDSLNLGQYQFTISEVGTDKILYSQGFATLFAEWQTTDEAKNMNRIYYGSVVFPYPKEKVLLSIYSRDRKNNFEKIFTYLVDPNNYFIKKKNNYLYDVDTIQYSGKPGSKYDIAFIPEGYTESKMDKFVNDCVILVNYLFQFEPFDKLKDKFNIWAVKASSVDSLCDIPADDEWYNTILNSSYYTFDSERYLMTDDFKRVRDLASNAPYDQIYILANSEKYGGGAIYNHYSLTVTNNPNFKEIFLHELGHGIAGLADEYGYDTTYNDFYQHDVEPWEKNITTLVNFDKKWESLVEQDTPIPTPSEEKYYNKNGVFEGAGYVAKGVYRSTYNSIMRSLSSDGFNKVSKEAIRDVILLYSE
ncbi:MAG: M64 family metallopeptidase [Bacteroidota bacterium]